MSDILTNRYIPVFGFCNAGCRHETMRRDDIEKLLTFVEQSIVNDIATVTPVGNYKICADIVSNAYDCSVKLVYTDSGEETEHTFTITECDPYREYFYFEILSQTTTNTTLTVVYEINGNRYTETINGTAIATTEQLKIEGATSVYKFNPDAQTTARDGKFFQTVAEFSIATTDWTVLASSTPFTYSATVEITPNYPLGENDDVMINFNDIVASSGVAAYSVEGTTAITIVFYSVGLPTQTITGTLGAVIYGS